ncbi:Nramp family divalent metal transporter [Millisia brevis]|uniref:Nramp family divalent metal transporter n=1 Tax=Millisia brevis TaxID=264148 RepID=UPI00082B3498
MAARRSARTASRPIGLLAPAVVSAVAYVDPGNFATNVSAGSQYGYLLVWVVVASSAIAMLVQYLSAKVGIVTGVGLAAICRERYPRTAARLLWVQAEIVAIATDLAEIVGGAIALYLLFDLPLLVGGLITGIVAFGMLTLRRRGVRVFDSVVVGLLAIILIGFVVDALMAGIDPPAILGGLVPRVTDTNSVLLAVAMIGATVMPHAIYLHGGLTGMHRRPEADPAAQLRIQRVYVVMALSGAGVMNLLLLVIAAAALSGRGIDTIEGAHAGIAATLGSGAALLFALALLASGLASSSVGTLAGQVVMDGFIQRRIPDVVRRLITLAPALAILASGVDPTRALVLSQVVLSFGIPFALVPLVQFTASRTVMGPYVNRRITTIAGIICAAVVIALNVVLIALAF